MTEAKILEMTADIVAAYASKNHIPKGELPDLIGAVHASLARISTGAPAADQPVAALEAPKAPAVPIKKSVHDDHIVCLEDGKSFKSLKRHLGAEHGMTPEAYRAKWSWPADYPMSRPPMRPAARNSPRASASAKRPPDAASRSKTSL